MPLIPRPSTLLVAFLLSSYISSLRRLGNLEYTLSSIHGYVGDFWLSVLRALLGWMVRMGDWTLERGVVWVLRAGWGVRNTNTTTSYERLKVLRSHEGEITNGSLVDGGLLVRYEDVSRSAEDDAVMRQRMVYGDGNQGPIGFPIPNSPTPAAEAMSMSLATPNPHSMPLIIGSVFKHPPQHQHPSMQQHYHHPQTVHTPTNNLQYDVHYHARPQVYAYTNHIAAHPQAQPTLSPFRYQKALPSPHITLQQQQQQQQLRANQIRRMR
ncbi:hypothetical protein BC832DRAFT_319610 [Gaertneriomyces semiglobifer]|nr:hypothetical protein BC832DRAFT_319610 [Gaertneriomyces semiglobifer]